MASGSFGYRVIGRLCISLFVELANNISQGTNPVHYDHKIIKWNALIGRKCMNGREFLFIFSAITPCVTLKTVSKSFSHCHLKMFINNFNASAAFQIKHSHSTQATNQKLWIYIHIHLI